LPGEQATVVFENGVLITYSEVIYKFSTLVECLSLAQNLLTLNSIVMKAYIEVQAWKPRKLVANEHFRIIAKQFICFIVYHI